MHFRPQLEKSPCERATEWVRAGVCVCGIPSLGTSESWGHNGNHVRWQKLRMHSQLWVLFALVVQSLSGVFVNPRTAVCQSSCPSLSPRVYSNSRSLSLMPSNHLILCRPLLFFLPGMNGHVWEQQETLTLLNSTVMWEVGGKQYYWGEEGIFLLFFHLWLLLWLNLFYNVKSHYRK